LKTKELDKIKSTQKESIQIDCTLVENGEDNDDSDDEESCKSDDGQESEPKKQMIEMSVSLGNFDANPIVSSLLASKNDGDEANLVGSAHDSDVDNGGNARRKERNDKCSSTNTTTTSLLKSIATKVASADSSSDTDGDDEPLMTVRSTKKRRKS